MARVSNMLQRGGGNQRALFINHVLLIVLWVPRTFPTDWLSDCAAA